MLNEPSGGGYSSHHLVSSKLTSYSLKLQYSIPKCSPYSQLGEWLEPYKNSPFGALQREYDTTLQLSKDSRRMINQILFDNGTIRSTFDTNTLFFKNLQKRVKVEPLPESCKDSGLESAYNVVDSHLTVLEKSLESQVSEVNHYVTNPSVEALEPLIRNSPFLSQVSENCRDSAVKEFFEVVCPDNLLDCFTSLIHLAGENFDVFCSKCIFYNEIISEVPASLEGDFLKVKTKLFGAVVGLYHHAPSVSGLLGFFSNDFVFSSSPEVLILPPVVFVSSLAWLRIMNEVPVEGLLKSHYSTLTLDFAKVFIESMHITGNKITSCYLQWKALGFLKSTAFVPMPVPWYLKLLKLIQDPPVSVTCSLVSVSVILAVTCAICYFVNLFF